MVSLKLKVILHVAENDSKYRRSFNYHKLLTKACGCIIRHVVTVVAQAFVGAVCTFGDTDRLRWAAVIESFRTLADFSTSMWTFISIPGMTVALVRTQRIDTRRIHRTGIRISNTFVHVYGSIEDETVTLKREMLNSFGTSLRQRKYLSPP